MLTGAVVVCVELELIELTAQDQHVSDGLGEPHADLERGILRLIERRLPANFPRCGVHREEMPVLGVRLCVASGSEVDRLVRCVQKSGDCGGGAQGLHVGQCDDRAVRPAGFAEREERQTILAVQDETVDAGSV